MFGHFSKVSIKIMKYTTVMKDLKVEKQHIGSQSAAFFVQTPGAVPQKSYTHQDSVLSRVLV